MRSLNKVHLMGNLGKNPETKKLSSKSKISRFSLAVNENWTDDQGNKQERVNWIPVVCWNGIADSTKYLRKGSHVLIEGSLRENTWEDKDTKKRRSRIEVIASNIIFLDKKPAEPEQISLPDPPDDQEEVPF